MIDEAWIEVACPLCHYEIDIQVIDVRLESTIICPNCKASIHLQDGEASVHQVEAEIDWALRDLQNQLRRAFG